MTDDRTGRRYWFRETGGPWMPVEPHRAAELRCMGFELTSRWADQPPPAPFGPAQPADPTPPLFGPPAAT